MLPQRHLSECLKKRLQDSSISSQDPMIVTVSLDLEFCLWDAKLLQELMLPLPPPQPLEVLCLVSLEESFLDFPFLEEWRRKRHPDSSICSLVPRTVKDCSDLEFSPSIVRTPPPLHRLEECLRKKLQESSTSSQDPMIARGFLDLVCCH